MEISVDHLQSADVLALLQEHLRSLAPTAPAESRHALDLAGLCAPDITFWTIRDGSVLAGFGALKHLSSTEAEIKSMRTANSHLRRGVASMMLRHLIGRRARLRAAEPGDRIHGILRTRAAPVCVFRIRALRAVRELPRGSQQRVHDPALGLNSGRRVDEAPCPCIRRPCVAAVTPCVATPGIPRSASRSTAKRCARRRLAGAFPNTGRSARSRRCRPG